MIEYFANHPPDVNDWLILTTALFSIGLYGLLSSRSSIRILMSVELMLNSAAINLVMFNRFHGFVNMDGSIFALFIIAVAAAEVVVAMAIFVSLFGHRKNLDVTQMSSMEG